MTVDERQELLRLRRHFHAHPELSMEERETSAYLEEYLRSMGLSPRRVGENGLSVIIEATNPGCKTVVIRAEMDAIAVKEQLDVPWKSQNSGIMHACGHDGILATALMLAKRCAENPPGVNVKFLFQPAEENGKGTAMMLQEGVMDQVDYFVMFHYVNDAPSGLELQHGEASAAIGGIQLTIHGKASHWCTRELGVDSIAAAARVISAIEELNDTYQSDAPFVLGIGTISGGTAKNVMAEETRLEGTLRAWKKEDYFALRQILLNKLAAIEARCGVRIDANIESDPIPPIVNDHALVELGHQVGSKIWESNCRTIKKQFLSGDSAAYYFDHAKGIFLVFTAEKPGQENYPLHNGKFDFDEAVMEKAVVFLYEYLKELGGTDAFSTR